MSGEETWRRKTPGVQFQSLFQCLACRLIGLTSLCTATIIVGCSEAEMHCLRCGRFAPHSPLGLFSRIRESSPVSFLKTTKASPAGEKSYSFSTLPVVLAGIAFAISRAQETLTGGTHGAKDCDLR